jgi:drug/metabolite transporter (DMT)-like permease
VILWASAFVAIRDIGPALAPAPLALLRTAVAAVALTVVAVVKSRGLPAIPRSPRALSLIAVYAVVWLAGYTVALNAAERHVDAGTAALLVNVAPLLVAFGAGVLLREGISRMLVLGAVVSFAGVGAIAAGTTAHRDGLGVILALVAAVLYAAGVLVQKAALRYVNSLMAIWLGSIIATVVLLPWTPQLAHAPALAVTDAIYLGLFPTALGFTAWSYALGRTEAARLTMTSYAIPAVSVLMSWLLLDEVPTAWALGGGAVCLIGVAISRRRSPMPAVLTEDNG